MKKKEFQTPTIEIISTEDIITSSDPQKDYPWGFEDEGFGEL